MKGLYVARLDLAKPHMLGVSRKIEDQMAAMAKAGLPAELLCLREGAIAQGSRTGAAPGGLGRRLNHHFHFHRAMAEVGSTVNFIYIRFQGAPPDFVAALTMLRRARPTLPIVVEFPSWPYKTERRGWRARAMGFYQDRGTGGLATCVDRVVTFSRAQSIFGVPTICTDNGVAVESLPLAGPPAHDDQIRLVGVANLSFWHGYDRVIAGLAEYNPTGGNKPRVTFDIAGGGTEFANLREQVEKSGLQEVVKLLGPVHGHDLDQLLLDAHVGISSIGMHRLDVDTSNIKSREFCARGLPFCIAYPDRDFPATLPFVHHLPQNDDPVDIAALVRWYCDLRDRDGTYPATMRAHAEAHLTWDAKMTPVIEWLRAQGAS